MIEVSHKQVSIEDVDAPDLLYKYRKWTDRYHRRMISDLEIYMASPASFEDLKDCRMYRKYDYTEDELYNIYINFLRKRNPSTNLSELNLQAIVAVQNVIGDPKAFTERFQVKEFNDFARMTGVLSLTERDDNVRMWEEYGENGSGFCVGFDGMELVRLFRNYGKVAYCDKLPEVTIGEDYDLQAWKQTYNKESLWSFEEKHRIRILNPGGLSESQRTVKVPKRAFKKVIFGWNMSEQNRLRIIRLCLRNNLNVTFHEAIHHNEHLAIRRLT